MTENWVDGATLVLVGSIGSDASCWDFVGVPSDAPRIEYPGHGKRDRVPGWTHATIVDEIVASVEGPIDVVGVALGATIAATLIHNHPERVRSAMLISGAPRLDLDPALAEQRLATSRARAEMPNDGGMAAVLQDTFARWFTPFAVRTDQPGVRYARERLLAMDPGAWHDIWMAGAISEPLAADRFRAFTGPVTIVAGISDFASGLRGPEQFHRLVPNSRFEIMPISHMAHLEFPEFVSAAIDRHSAWIPIGQRVEPALGSSAWPPIEDLEQRGSVVR